MATEPSALASWTPGEIEEGRRWVRTWQQAGPALERIRRDELRRLDAYQAIARLCGPADYRQPPRAPKPTSGLVDQQRYFRKLRP
ncbi:MAG: hypothetical protein AB1635_09020 [Acidobacteriota bacterium]